MVALRTWSRFLLAAMTLLFITPFAFAERTTTKLRSTELTSSGTTAPRESSGSPEIGLLVIVGVIAFLILVAWIFSRISEGKRPADNTLN